jgi:hypothetical protein
MNIRPPELFLHDPNAFGDSPPEIRRRGKTKISITLTLCASICSAAPAVGVVGGSGDASSFGDRVVMVLTRGPEGSGFCSAVVLSPRIVLTAAHCLRAPTNMRVHFLDASGRPLVLEVAAVLPHPQYRPDAQARRTRSLDVGLVETKEALPDDFRRFGVSTEGQAKSGGRLREATLRVREPRSRVLLWAAPIEGDAGGCSGDSGGPIFGSDGKTIVAIVAWTDGKGESKCGELTQGVLVAPIVGWIRAAIGRFNAETTPEIGR